MPVIKVAYCVLLCLVALGCEKKSDATSESPRESKSKAPNAASENSSAAATTPTTVATNENTRDPDQVPHEPEQEAPPAKNPAPLSFTEISERVDLRKLPIPEDGSFDRRFLNEAWMKIDRDVSGTADFVRKHLAKQGCKEIDSVFDLPDPHVGLAFEADDVLVTAFLSPETESSGDTPLTNFSVTVVGNLDARKLPSLQGTETKDARRSNVQLVTTKPVQDTVDQIIKRFSSDGWVLFEDPTGLKRRPNADPQSLSFIQNGIILDAYVSAKAIFQNKGKTTILLSFKVLNSELPLPPKAEDISLDVNGGKLRCQTPMEMSDVAEHYTSRFDSLGWKSKGKRIGEKDANLSFQRGNDINLVELDTSKEGTDVQVVGLIDKHPEDEKRARAREEAKRQAKATNPIPFPIPDGAEQIKLSADKTEVEFRILMSTKDLAEYYRKAFAEIGWKEHSRFTNLDRRNANMNFSDGDDDSTALNCLKLPNEELTRVSAHATRCTWTLPERKTEDAKPEATETDEPLEAEMR